MKYDQDLSTAELDKLKFEKDQINDCPTLIKFSCCAIHNNLLINCTVTCNLICVETGEFTEKYVVKMLLDNCET